MAYKTSNPNGQATMANSEPVVLASDQASIPVTLTSTTVTGTVAVTQSGTWDEVGINDSGNSITVDNAQLSVVGTGTEAAAMRVTIATDSTGLLSVDDNGGSLTVDGTITANLSATDNAVLDAIEADTTTIAGAVAGTEMQVDVVAALPAGTNNIGDVDVLSIAAGDNNIGNVDVVTLPALAAGTNAIGKLLPPNIDVTGHTNYAKKYYTNAGAVTDGIIWSPAAGTRWHITSIYIQTSAAATITLEDDLAGGDSPVWKSEFTANQGVYMTFDPMYAWASGEDAADLIITTTAGNVYVTAVGYEI